MNIMITSENLGNGQWLIADDTALKSWVTTQDQNAEVLRQNELELVRTGQRSNDYKANKDKYISVEAAIAGATLLPEPNTIPEQYRVEWPVGNWYVDTRNGNRQKKSIAASNENYMNTVEAPALQTEIAIGNDIMEQIKQEPTGGSDATFSFLPVPQDIPQGTEEPLLIDATSTISREVTYVEVTATINHPSPEGEKLTIGLYSPDGSYKELAHQDFPGTSTWATSYFNGLFTEGVWKLSLLNDTTTQVNILVSASLKLFYD